MPADLFTPLTLRETELPNRLIVSPMCQYAVDDRDPYFGLHAADELGVPERNEPPVQYRRVL